MECKQHYFGRPPQLIAAYESFVVFIFVLMESVMNQYMAHQQRQHHS